MARTPQKFTYEYSDISELTGMSFQAVYQYKRRGLLDPESLESVILFVCGHGHLEFRRKMFERMVSQNDPEGARAKKREARVKKKAKKPVAKKKGVKKSVKKKAAKKPAKSRSLFGKIKSFKKK